jgi:hypothetical protein
MTPLFSFYVIFVITLQWLLRLFGAFWIVGGILTFRAARQSSFIDTVLEAISQTKEDRLLSRFLWLSAVLTTLSGVALVLASPWVFAPLTLLILSQILYFRLQSQRFQRAQTEEEREEARVKPATVNAFKVCWGVAALAGLGWYVGALR